MKEKKRLIILTCLFCFCIFSRLETWAEEEDFFFEKKTETFINSESAGPPKILKVWMKKDRIRYETEGETDKYVLIQMDKGKTFELDKTQKNFKETSLEMDKLKEMNERTMVVSKRTGEKKKIEKWNCYEVILDTTMQGQKMKATCWLTEEIKISPETVQKIAKFSQMKLMEELAKFPGYPVKMTMDSTLKGKQVKVINTLINIEKKPLKEDFFKLPFDYAKVSP